MELFGFLRANGYGGAAMMKRIKKIIEMSDYYRRAARYKNSTAELMFSGYENESGDAEDISKRHPELNENIKTIVFLIPKLFSLIFTIVFLVYLTESILFFRAIIKKSAKLPVKTFKTIFLTIISFAVVILAFVGISKLGPVKQFAGPVFFDTPMNEHKPRKRDSMKLFINTVLISIVIYAERSMPKPFSFYA